MVRKIISLKMIENCDSDGGCLKCFHRCAKLDVKSMKMQEMQGQLFSPGLEYCRNTQIVRHAESWNVSALEAVVAGRMSKVELKLFLLFEILVRCTPTCNNELQLNIVSEYQILLKYSNSYELISCAFRFGLSLLGIAFLQSLSSQGNVAIETVQGAALDFILTHSLIAQKLMGDADKKSWASFQERIAKAPEQVLRYCRSASSKPLWPLSGGRPSKADIARCSYYGGPLCFEFQILPQLVYFFGVKDEDHSLDWATIAVYTCEASCEGIGYKEEFAWVQLSPSTNFP
ncbi:Zinc finger (MYND type) family protein / programmed cell death 2 C-terminal domain-containing protein [Theobroma cacao]|uniref:Zinc finger (MYND type) family protein / programmed cell death 2 C-terminal domain-containing protein n=1 Tax=Theobroma cacao TaxID=3641 RepID=A0A061F5N1_THECC|nr:Zinc finger (MYND type) family protein / programmed cell death 2 C-terminal domain-containing protein [Theobroma cacao]